MTEHRLNTANAADLFEGQRPEERTLIASVVRPPPSVWFY
jgi:hypothetical protein